VKPSLCALDYLNASSLTQPKAVKKLNYIAQRHSLPSDGYLIALLSMSIRGLGPKQSEAKLQHSAGKLYSSLWDKGQNPFP